MTALLAEYILPFSMIVMSAILYLKMAAHFHIIDKPNERSSHLIPSIRGGGIIFVVSAILFYFWNGLSYPYLLAAVLISGIVSFIDDIWIVSNRLKLSAHIVSVLLIFMECGLLTTVSPLYLVAMGIFVIGVINAYNFMDGINGITGLYSLAVIVPLFLTEANEKLQSLELFLMMGLLVFNFFNTRKKAICFAGDVGSISLAILIVFLLIMRIQQTHHVVYIGFLLVYGMDTVATIILRLIRREDIFKAHRSHFFQYLANEQKIPHVWIAVVYCGIQLIINWILLTQNQWIIILSFSSLIMTYGVLRLKLEGFKRLFKSYAV